jgi:hypothetical protein
MSAIHFLQRHAHGDWGEVDEEDRQANADALIDGSRLLSAYRTSLGEKLWIITEAAGHANGVQHSCKDDRGHLVGFGEEAADFGGEVGSGGLPPDSPFMPKSTFFVPKSTFHKRLAGKTSVCSSSVPGL